MEGDNIRYVSAGEYHSGAASETTLYGWGANGYFCTGVGRGNLVQVRNNTAAGGVARCDRALCDSCPAPSVVVPSCQMG